MPKSSVRLWPPDSNKTASGKPGAVQFLVCSSLRAVNRGSGRGRRGHIPFIMLSWQSKLPPMDDLYTPAGKLRLSAGSSAGSRPPKSSGYAPASRPGTSPSSANSGQTVLTGVADQPGIVHERHVRGRRSHRARVTPPFRWADARLANVKNSLRPPRLAPSPAQHLPRHPGRLRLAPQPPLRPGSGPPATRHRRQRPTPPRPYRLPAAEPRW